MLAFDNSLAMDLDSALPPDVETELVNKGYTRDELLAVTHSYIGRKVGMGIPANLKRLAWCSSLLAMRGMSAARLLRRAIRNMIA